MKKFSLFFISLLLPFFLFVPKSHADSWSVTGVNGNQVEGLPCGTAETFQLTDSIGFDIDQASYRSCSNGVVTFSDLDPNKPFPDGTYFILMIGTLYPSSNYFTVSNGVVVDNNATLLPKPAPVTPFTPSITISGMSGDNGLNVYPFVCSHIGYDVYNINNQLVAHVGGCGGNAQIMGLYDPVTGNPYDLTATDGAYYVYGYEYTGIQNNALSYNNVYSNVFYIHNGGFYTSLLIINAISNATINEGDTYSANGSFTDLGSSSSWTATVDYGDGAGAQPLTLSGTNFSLNHVYQDNGNYTVTVRVTDNQGATGTGTATVTVNNVAPTPGAITAPSSPVLVNTAITASANFTDPGVLDTHNNAGTYWNWGDGNTTTGTVIESNGSGSVSDSHTYTATGVYTITLKVTDKDGGEGTSTYQYVAVYDSNTSFAGGRSFDNPTNASPTTAGKVSFGISAKYNNSNVLTGSAKMDFKAASLDFVSTSLQSLATSNGKAYLKGAGTLNGNSGYTFLASGIDGSVAGGNDLIRFQIKDGSGNVVYDSQPGANDTTDPTTTDATGNIRVH